MITERESRAAQIEIAFHNDRWPYSATHEHLRKRLEEWTRLADRRPSTHNSMQVEGYRDLLRAVEALGGWA